MFGLCNVHMTSQNVSQCSRQCLLSSSYLSKNKHWQGHTERTKLALQKCSYSNSQIYFENQLGHGKEISII